MATNTYKAQLNYHDSRWGWGNEGTASQGAWDGTGTRTGVLYFPGLAALKNKIINSVRITVTTGQTGWGLATTKTVNFYRSAAQGGIKTSLNANHKTGSAIGSVKGAMYNNTVTYTAAFLAARIAAGDDTYCIYNGSSSTDYLKWTSVSLEVNWSEPATQPSLSKSTVEMGTAVTISTPAANSGYRHTLRYAFSSASGTIASGVASSYSWTPPVSLAAQIPSATSGSGTIYCDTYSGSTLLGTKSVSITLTVPASVRPTAGTLSAAVADDSSGTGMYVKGMGKARVTLSGAAGAQGSSIRSVVISGGGWSASGNTLLTGVLTAAGTVTFTATVTDSRGRTASTTTSISVIDYARPGISSCTVYRCNSAGARQNDGTYAAVEIKAFYSAISGNTLSLGVAYKRSSESSYGGSTTLTNNGKTIIGGGGLSASTTYDVRVTVSDKYNTVEQVYSLPTKSVLLSFLKNLGAAIGKVAELSGWLDIGLNTRIREDLQVDGNVTWSGKHEITYQDIPDGADLNDYRYSGFYRSWSSANTGIINKPADCSYAFELIVTGISDASYCTQRIKTHESNREWIRTQTSWQQPYNAWTDWTEIASLIGGAIPVSNGGTGATTAKNARYTLGVPAELGVIPGIGFPFGYGVVVCRGGLGNTIGQSTDDNYYWGVDSDAKLWGGKQTGGATSPTWARAAMMDGELGWKSLWKGTLTSGTITLPSAQKYTMLMVYGPPGSGENSVISVTPAGGGVQIQHSSNIYSMVYSINTSGSDDLTLTLNMNNNDGSIQRVWGLVRNIT